MPEQPKPPTKRRSGGRFGLLSLRDRLAVLVPEHFGDLFTSALVFAFAIGAALFWFFAWLPANESPTQREAPRIVPFFDEDELRAIVEIIEAREEASTAPVLDTPARDPFRYGQ